MTIVGPGRFKVTSRENISVLIEKSIAPYSAEVSELSHGAWNPKPNNNGGLTAQGAFLCPTAQGDSTSFGILFNFIPSPNADDNSGDFYKVNIKGSNGGESPQMIFGPGFTTRTYQFEVA